MLSSFTTEVIRPVAPDRSWLGVAYRLMDAACIVLALFCVAVLSPYPWWDDPWQRLYPLAGACTVGCFYLFAEYQGLYLGARGASFGQELRRVGWVWLATILALLLLSFGSKVSADYPRRVILAWFVVVPLMLTVWRWGFGWLLRQVRGRFTVPERVAIVGVGVTARRLAESITASPWTGMQIDRVYEDTASAMKLEVSHDQWPISHDWLALLGAARAGRIDSVFITLPLTENGRAQQMIQSLADTPCAVYVVPDMFLSDLLHARWRSVNGLSVVNVFESPLEGIDGTIKRVLDVIISLAVLVVAALPMCVIACAVKWTSPGPVLYRQTRYGLDGREIKVWKFRSMFDVPDERTFRQAQRNDRRVTPLGHLLRRYSLDELPQFVNVLQGSMSIVGPRPHPVALNEQHRKQIRGYMLRHRVKPGITGLAQVNGWRGETDSPEKMQKRIELDLEYIRNWSVGLDLIIMAKTLRRMLRDDNAF